MHGGQSGQRYWTCCVMLAVLRPTRSQTRYTASIRMHGCRGEWFIESYLSRCNVSAIATINNTRTHYGYHCQQSLLQMPVHILFSTRQSDRKLFTAMYEQQHL